MARRRAFFWVDRGAVLMLGVATGLVLGLSLRSGGPVLGPVLAAFDAAGHDHARAPGTPAPPAVPVTHSEAPAVAAPGTPAVAAAAPAADYVGADNAGQVSDCLDHFPSASVAQAARASGRRIDVGVFGDSYGDGLAAVAANDLPSARFAVHRLSREGTGFTRYYSRDLLADTRARLAAQPVDVALISFGANDTYAIWDHHGAAAYMSPRWQAVIGERITALVRDLTARGIVVGWMGLPHMRDPDFDRDIVAMDHFLGRVLCPLGVGYTAPLAISGDADGHWSLALTDPSTSTRYVARTSDGKHMTFHGYQVAARPLLSRLAAAAGAP